MDKWVTIVMFLCWFVLGIITIATGHVTMIMFGCLWICYMLEVGGQIYDQNGGDWRFWK